jgi:hypothetical protein
VNKNIDEIKQKFVEDIKQNPQDWHIEEKDNSVIVKHKSGKEYYKEGFLKNEGFQESSLGRKRWSEIKNALSSADDVGEKNQSYRNFIIVVVVSLLLMLAFIIYKRKRT